MPRIHRAEASYDLSVARALVEEYVATLGFDLGFQDVGRELADFPAGYAAPDGCLLLAELDGRSAGCVAVRRFSSRICEMKRLYVLPKRRGHGVGRALARAAIEHARALGYERMRLDTIADMTEADSLYRSLGFEEIAPYRPNPIEGARFFELEL